MPSQRHDPPPETGAPADCAPEWLERIAHDIRSPLGVLAQTIEILQERLEGSAGAPPPDTDRAVVLAGRARRRLELLAERLSLQAAVQRNRVDVAPQRVDLAAVVQAAIEDVWRVHGRREVVLDRSLPERCDVRGDPPKLERAVAELLVNAVHHAHRRVNLTLACHAPTGGGGGGRARLVVEDDGAGVSPETAASLFLRRGPSHGGLGIGLTMAQWIARTHGGQVVLESTPGQPGARFALDLPLLEP